MSITEARKYTEVTPPPINQGGFLGTVGVLTVSDGDHGLLGVEYETLACTKGNSWEDICYSEPNLEACSGGAITPPTGGFKQFETTEVVQGDPRPIYAGVDCQRPGRQGATDEAREAFSYAEPRLVDEMMVAWLEANKQGSDLVAASVNKTILDLEDIIGATYGGYGVIVLSRGAVTHAASQRLVFRAPDGSLETVNGTKVVGYASSTVASPSAAYATGQINLVRGPVLDRWVPETIVSGAPDTCYPARQLAERIYVPLVECLIQKALVNDPA